MKRNADIGFFTNPSILFDRQGVEGRFCSYQNSPGASTIAAKPSFNLKRAANGDTNHFVT
jgi:hypothetical protein